MNRTEKYAFRNFLGIFLQWKVEDFFKVEANPTEFHLKVDLYFIRI